MAESKVPCRAEGCKRPSKTGKPGALCSACYERRRLSDPAKRRAAAASALRRYHERRSTDPEFDERIRTYNRERMRRLATDPAWRENRNAKRRALWQNDPRYRDDRNAKQRAYYAKRGGHGYQKHLAELLARQGFVCPLCDELICGEDYRRIATVDHIVPQSKGGGHEKANLQVVHLHCNTRKGNRG